MDNRTAKERLIAARNAINSAINELDRYVLEMDNWTDDVKTSSMASIKVDATTGGVDIDAWDGAAPA